MNASQLIGKEVLDVHANSVGKVADFDLNFPQWTVSRIIVKMGMLKKVPVEVDKIDKIGDKVLLKITRIEVEKSPAPVK
jgi:sporulation protein YlmC with PRC-barrel domain